MRRSIKKPSQKSPRASRRRSEADRPPSPSSSSGASKAALFPEPDATTESPSPSKSSRSDSSARRSQSRSPKKASSKQPSSSRPKSPLPRTPPRPKSPVQPSSSRPKSPLPRSPTGLTSPTKRTRSRTPSPIASPGSSRRSPPRTRSPRKKATPSKSPTGKRSPTKETATVKSPTKRKHSRSPSKPDPSLLTISETAPETVTSRISRSTPFGETLGRLVDQATSKVAEVESGFTSRAPDGKTYVFLPTSAGIDRELLGRLMSQVYGYLKTLKEGSSAQCSTEPSAPPYESDTGNDDFLEIVVIDCRNPPRRDDPAVSEHLIEGVSNLGYASSSPPTKAPETSSSSSTSSSTTLTNPKGKLQYNPDLTKRRHSAEAAVGLSHSAPESSKWRLRSRPPLLRQRHEDFDSNCSIEVLELQDVPETPKTPSPTSSKRRRSKDMDRDAKTEDAPPPKPARKKSFDGASRSSQDKCSPPKPTKAAPESQQTSLSGYRDVRRSLESEEDIIEVIEVLTVGRSESTDSQQFRNDFRDWCSGSFTASWNFPQEWTDSSPSLPRAPRQHFWQVCYKRFIDSFEERSATAQKFFQNLTGTLVARIRQPGQPAPRRYVLIAGLHIWVLIREASNDFWFLCGGGSDRSNSPKRIPGPTVSLESFGGAEPAQPQQEVPNLTKKAQKAAAKAEKKARKKMKRQEEEKGETLRELIELIHNYTPVRPIEPRRDFVPNDCPFITLSFEENTPEEPAVAEAPAEASGEAKPVMSHLCVPERKESEAMPPRRRESASKND